MKYMKSVPEPPSDALQCDMYDFVTRMRFSQKPQIMSVSQSVTAMYIRNIMIYRFMQNYYHLRGMNCAE